MAGGILTVKKWLLLFLAILMIGLTIKSASADINTDTLAYYKLDVDDTIAAKAIDITSNGYGGLQVGVLTNQSGKINESYYFDGIDDRVDVPNNYSIFSGTKNFSINVWINWTDGADAIERIFDLRGENYLSLCIQNNELRFLYRTGAVWNIIQTGVILQQNKWKYMVTITYDEISNNLSIYLNNTLVNSSLIASFDNNNGDNRFGDRDNNGDSFEGKIDEIGIWNITLTNAQINTIWNGGSGRQYPYPIAPIIDNLNLSEITPYPKAQYNSNPAGPFWVLGNASAAWTCRLYVNGSVNQTQTLGIGTNVNCSFNTNFSNGAWSVFIRGNTSLVDENTSTSTIYYDNATPQITVINWTNGTLRYDTNLTGQWNITDNFFLYRLNASIDGTQFFGVTEINSTQYTYNLSRDISNLTPGNHTLTIQVADGHTALSIPDYDWYNGLFNDYLQYETGKATIRIDTIDGSIWDSFTTTKQKDRYTFDYEPYDTKKTSYSFIVTSDKALHVIKKPSSKISQWLIINNHWLDFYIPGTTVNINKIDKHTARIEVTGIKDTSKLSFSSIGDLNIVTRNYTFTTTNMSVTYSQYINELETNTILLRINTTGTVTGTQAALLWNGTYQAATKTVNALHDLYNATFLTPTIPTGTQLINFTWFYNVTGTVNNLTGNITNNQTLVQIGIDNCSVFTTRAVNISIRDESNNSLVVGSINGFFEVWISSLSQFRAFNLTWNGASQYGICINNASANYTTNSQMEYSASGYSAKNYYMRNYTLDNVTDILDLYLTKNSTQVTLRVTDYDDNPIKDVYIHIQSYDLGTNSYKTTEIVKTDFQGKAFAEMTLFTQWYQFMLVYQGETVLQTDATKLTSTTLNFQIDLGSNNVATYNKVEKMTCSISFNNATNNFRMDFSNPSGLPILATLDVYNSTTYITNLFNSSSLTSASGTILINIAPPKNETYTGKGFVTISGTKYSCGTPQSVSFGSDYQTWGLQGIFYTILVCIFLVCVGIWSPAIAVLLLIIAVIITNLFGMFHMNTPYLITFIILGGITLYRLARNRV